MPSNDCFEAVFKPFTVALGDTAERRAMDNHDPGAASACGSGRRLPPHGG